MLLPNPPSINHYWRHCRGQNFISKEGKAYRMKVLAAVFSQPAVLRADWPILGPLIIEVYWNPPDNRKRDLDNILKPLLDALQHAGVYRDDSQIVRIVAERMEPVRNGSVQVDITESDSPAEPGEQPRG